MTIGGPSILELVLNSILHTLNFWEYIALSVRLPVDPDGDNVFVAKRVLKKEEHNEASFHTTSRLPGILFMQRMHPRKRKAQSKTAGTGKGRSGTAEKCSVPDQGHWEY